MLLARIDKTPSIPASTLFIKALDKAYSSEEKLRVLKRLAKTDRETVLAVVDLCSKKKNTEPVVLALIDYYLDMSRFNDAFSLFSANLSCRDYPDLFAEIILSALKNNVLLPEASLENLHLAGIEASQPALLYCAALKCMAMGNPSAAALFLRESASQSFSAPMSILWDAGVFEEIQKREISGNDSEALHYILSSAYIEGNLALAANISRQFLLAAPQTAWQAYLAMGVLASQAEKKSDAGNQYLEGIAPLDWPHLGLNEGNPERGNADFWFSEALRLFPGRFEVLDAGIKRFMQSEDIALLPEKIKTLPRDQKNDCLRFFLDIKDESSQRVCALAMELAAKYPDSPEVINLVLFSLFKQRSWENFLSIFNQAEKKYFALEINSFHRIVANVCGENIEASIEAVKKENSSKSYAYIYNLGLLELAARNYNNAMDAMKTAATKADTVKQKVRALIHVSSIAKIQGNIETAEAYKKSAISLDSNCLLLPENFSLLYGQ